MGVFHNSLEVVLEENADKPMFMLSLSMPDYNTTTTTTSSPTTSPTTLNGTFAPTVAPSTNTTIDTFTLFPTIILDDDNVTTDAPTTTTPAGQQQKQLPIFECTAAGLATDGEVAQEVFLTVGYMVESTSMKTMDFEKELERQLLETAVLAALGGCGGNDGGAASLLNVRGHGRRQVLEMDTIGRIDRRLDNRPLTILSDSTTVGRYNHRMVLFV